MSRFYGLVVIILSSILFPTINAQSGDGEISCELHKRNDYECLERIKEFKVCKTVYCKFPQEAFIPEPGTILGNSKNKRVKLLYFSCVKGINYLPDGISENFPDLEEIDGYNSSLMDLTYENLRSLFDLEKINLGMNKITNINEDAFSDLTFLKVLNLGSNKIKKLHPETFLRNGNLEKLNLDDNQIDFLDPKLFKNNSELVVLILSNNNLKIIEPGTFNSLPLLTQLSLGNNKISILPAFVFRNNKKLLTLWLSHNKLTKVDKCLLENSPNLETFGMSENNLEMIDFAMFKDNKNIRNIYFYKGGIQAVKNIEIVNKLKKLQTVNFQGNICIDKEYTSACVIELRQDLFVKCRDKSEQTIFHEKK